MKKSTARWIFVAFSCALVVQFWIMSHGFEPYPAFCYPTFHYLAKSESEMNYSKPEFVAVFADGSKEPVNTFQLFAMVPISHVNHLVAGTLAPGEQSEAAEKPFRKFHFGGDTYEFRRTQAPPTAKEKQQLNEFFVRRVAALTGRTDAVKLEIQWIQRRFEYGRGGEPDDQGIEKQRVFDLRSDAWQ